MKVTNLLFIILFSVACAQIQSAKESPVGSPLFRNQSGFQDCYIKSESYQNADQSIQGQVQLQFSLGPEGEVYNDAIAHSDFKESAFHNCILKELRGTRYLEKKNEENLTYTLKFVQVKNEKL